jgi:hypothetical protein
MSVGTSVVNKARIDVNKPRIVVNKPRMSGVR